MLTDSALSFRCATKGLQRAAWFYVGADAAENTLAVYDSGLH